MLVLVCIYGVITSLQYYQSSDHVGGYLVFSIVPISSLLDAMDCASFGICGALLSVVICSSLLPPPSSIPMSVVPSFSQPFRNLADFAIRWFDMFGKDGQSFLVSALVLVSSLMTSSVLIYFI